MDVIPETGPATPPLLPLPTSTLAAGAAHTSTSRGAAPPTCRHAPSKSWGSCYDAAPMFKSILVYGALAATPYNSAAQPGPATHASTSQLLQQPALQQPAQKRSSAPGQAPAPSQDGTNSPPAANAAQAPPPPLTSPQLPIEPQPAISSTLQCNGTDTAVPRRATAPSATALSIVNSADSGVQQQRTACRAARGCGSERAMSTPCSMLPVLCHAGRQAHRMSWQ